jgi:hypothetical protein
MDKKITETTKEASKKVLLLNLPVVHHRQIQKQNTTDKSKKLF